ncbi:unnamed protein product [Hermetia illucens]|uniref:Serine protease HTRA2, mitochondrial n=1 Tax=Hermetia illucens TaxID=343691 RepID=A0A7R8UTW0_HERIL|nr:serine protease HTRA2, mitochondrial-like [Hermetia illucens]CAD7086979.1 unnamed protein product [Hermetia illucens]
MALRSVLKFKYCPCKVSVAELFRGSKAVTTPHLQPTRALHQRSSSSQGFGNSKRRTYLFYGVCGVLAAGGYVAAYMGLIKKLNVPPFVAAMHTRRRYRFNFISDVSEVASPAIVYLELRDTKRFNQITGQHVPISAGSGFLVKSDGLIVTNAHVILQKMSPKSNIKIVAKLHDGRVFDASVESVDREADLATIRIAARQLPTIKLGRSVGIMPGEWVLALGSPLALSNTVTCGVVSAYRKSEEIGLEKGKTVYIQTDASINNGNSGGPLMNVEGEAIGVNSMNIIPGISFATPIDEVRRFLKETTDEVRRLQMCREASEIRYLGGVMLNLTPAIVTELIRNDLNISPKIRFGVLMQRIVPNSPAEAGGLLPGDIVTHVNGKEVKSTADIYNALSEKSKLNLTVHRAERQLKIVVTPED